MGTSLRKGDHTRAAVRAVQAALWRNSVSFAEAFGFEKSDMLIDVEIGVQKPDEVDRDEVKAVLYGNGDVNVVAGGLDVPKPDGSGVTILANAPLSSPSIWNGRHRHEAVDPGNGDRYRPVWRRLHEGSLPRRA